MPLLSAAPHKRSIRSLLSNSKKATLLSNVPPSVVRADVQGSSKEVWAHSAQNEIRAPFYSPQNTVFSIPIDHADGFLQIEASTLPI